MTREGTVHLEYAKQEQSYVGSRDLNIRPQYMFIQVEDNLES